MSFNLILPKLHMTSIVTSNEEKEKLVLKQCLAKEFEIKELERLKYLFGIEVAHSK